MKKSLIALAVLGTSFAASAQVTLGGRAAMEVGNWQATGSGDATKDFRDRSRVADVGSRVILRVNEDLGGGLRAFAMCETGINIDNGSNTGQANSNNANTTSWCSREGHLGIGNRTAEVRLGRQNVWWTQGAINVVGAVYHAGDAVTDLLTGSLGQYTVRGENMVMLMAGPGTGAWAGSNVYMGFMGASGNIDTGAAAGGTSVTSHSGSQLSHGQDMGESVRAGQSSAGRYQGLKVSYSQGALVGSFDMQTSETGNSLVGSGTTVPVGANVERSAWKLGAGYRYSGAKSPNIVSIQYVDRSRTITPLNGTGAKRTENVVMLVGQYALTGGWLLNATYGRASDQKLGGATQVDTGANAYGVGVVKTLSNRTHAYFQYRTIENKAKASYGMNGGNYASAPFGGGIAAGSDSKAWGLGLVHNF